MDAVSRHREKVLAHAEAQLALQGKESPAELLALYKRFIKIENHRLRLKHHAGEGGREIAHQRASLVDIVLRHLYDGAAAKSGVAGAANLRELSLVFPEDGAVTAKSIEVRDGNVVSCTGTARDNTALLRTLGQLRDADEVSQLKVEQIRGKSPMQFTFEFHWGNDGGGNEN